MLHQILGHAYDCRFRGRKRERLWVAAADAGRRRLRVRSELGTEIGLDLHEPRWLADGTVLHDDGHRILVVARKPEQVMVVTLPESDPATAFRIGHALGNRHTPSEIDGCEIVVPVTETPELAARPLLAYGVDQARIRFEERAFAAGAPPACAGASHEHPVGRAHVHHHHDKGAHEH
ncbi:urease accessory protein UreE [Paracoccus nototheniae]